MQQRKRTPRLRAVTMAISAALFLAMVLPVFAQQPVAPENAIAPTAAGGGVLPDSADLPDSPGATVARLEQATQQGTNPSAAAQQDSAAANSSAQNQAPTSQSQPAQPQPQPQKPVGTATAEAPTTTGIAASQPAGVAIAPAKQHCVRTIVLRTGAIIAAAVAVGTVVALTEATPPKPPGAH